MFEIFKNKILLYGVIAAIFLIISLSAAISILTSKVKELKEDNVRLESNYTAQTDSVHKWVTKYGDLVSENIAEKLKVNEILGSRDKEIIKLKNYVDRLGIKIKNLEFMLSIGIDSNVDTTANVQILYLPGETKYETFDTLRIGESYIYRRHLSGDSLAKYKIHLGGSLYVFYEGGKKQGKWKLRNLFIWRKKLPIISITSDNSLLNIKDMKLVVIEK